MNFHKRIILDFDDTLAFAKNRNWFDAVPNKELIAKTNRLYDEGWQIDIFTARGSISCSSRQEAATKYKPGMEAWLNKNGVKYHSISFDKPLAAYYIDDKGITPEEFLNINIEKLEGGLSGSDLYSDGKMVHKQDKNAHIVRAWYESVNGIKVPYVDRIVGNTISMEYIHHNKDFFKNNLYVALGLIQNALCNLKANDIPQNVFKYRDYCYRIMDHAKASEKELFINVAKKIAQYELEKSFSHGDFGITNMLFTKDQQLVLIDPIPNVFGCTELDAAKFIASLYINKYPSNLIKISFNSMALFNDIAIEKLMYLVAAEIIRVYKYHPDKNFIIGCVKNVFE